MNDPRTPNSLDRNTANSRRRAIKGIRWLIPSLVIVIMLAIASCRLLLRDKFLPEYPPTPDYSYTPEYSPADFEAELEKNRMKWDSKLVTHYRMSVDLSELGTYGEAPWIIEVQEGDFVSITDPQGQIVLPTDYVDIPVKYQNFFTVPALFSYVEQTYLSEPPAIRIEYDTTYGYPKTIYVDPWVEPCCMDYTVVIRDLQMLP